METYQFSIQFGTYAELAKHLDEYAKFQQWRDARAATRITDRRGKHVAAIHARAKELCMDDATLTYRMAFRLAACKIAEEEDAKTV